jgi:hypothetical protein
MFADFRTFHASRAERGLRQILSYRLLQFNAGLSGARSRIDLFAGADASDCV